MRKQKVYNKNFNLISNLPKNYDLFENLVYLLCGHHYTMYCSKYPYIMFITNYLSNREYGGIRYIYMDLNGESDKTYSNRYLKDLQLSASKAGQLSFSSPSHSPAYTNVFYV